MTMTEKLTAKQVLALARKKWSGKVDVREYKSAPVEPERTQIRERRDALRLRKEVLEKAVRDDAGAFGELLTAARFALDVDGDEPSWSKLQATTVKAERLVAFREELADVFQELRSLSGATVYHRFEVVELMDLGSRTLAGADTLEELAKKAKLA